MLVISTAHPGIAARITRWVTQGSVSHSLGAYWSRDFKSWVVMEALVGRGFVPMPASRRLEELRRDGRIVHRLRFTADEEERFLCHVFANIWALRYDNWHTLGWLIPGLANRMQWRHKSWVPRWNPAGRFNCSEAFASSLADLGYSAFHARMHPAMLAAALSASGLGDEQDTEETWQMMESNVPPKEVSP